MSIKIPLEYIAKHPEDDLPESRKTNTLVKKLVEYLLGEYTKNDDLFAGIIENAYAKKPEEIKNELLEDEYPFCLMLEKYALIIHYFDRLAEFETSEGFERIISIKVREASETEM